MSNDTECTACGRTEPPEKGWIHPSDAIRPKDIVDGEIVFEAEEDAEAYCSTDCLWGTENGDSA